MANLLNLRLRAMMTTEPGDIDGALGDGSLLSELIGGQAIGHGQKNRTSQLGKRGVSVANAQPDLSEFPRSEHYTKVPASCKPLVRLCYNWKMPVMPHRGVRLSNKTKHKLTHNLRS
jgi:hypothetical protein